MARMGLKLKVTGQKRDAVGLPQSILNQGHFSSSSYILLHGHAVWHSSPPMYIPTYTLFLQMLMFAG